MTDDSMDSRTRGDWERSEWPTLQQPKVNWDGQCWKILTDVGNKLNMKDMNTLVNTQEIWKNLLLLIAISTFKEETGSPMVVNY